MKTFSTFMAESVIPFDALAGGVYAPSEIIHQQIYAIVHSVPTMKSLGGMYLPKLDCISATLTVRAGPDGRLSYYTVDTDLAMLAATIVQKAYGVSLGNAVVDNVKRYTSIFMLGSTPLYGDRYCSQESPNALTVYVYLFDSTTSAENYMRWRSEGFQWEIGASIIKYGRYWRNIDRVLRAPTTISLRESTESEKYTTIYGVAWTEADPVITAAFGGDPVGADGVEFVDFFRFSTETEGLNNKYRILGSKVFARLYGSNDYRGSGWTDAQFPSGLGNAAYAAFSKTPDGYTIGLIISANIEVIEDDITSGNWLLPGWDMLPTTIGRYWRDITRLINSTSIKL